MENSVQGGMAKETRRSGRIHARVLAGAPSTEIVRIAQGCESDLIVVGVPARDAMSPFDSEETS